MKHGVNPRGPAVRALALTTTVGLAFLLASPPVAGQDAIVFEDESLPSRTKGLLSSYANVVKTWGMVQRVVETVHEQVEEAEPMEEILEVDRAWAAGDDPGNLARKLTSNDCAEALQSALSANPGYLDAFVMDDRGVLVCATRRPDRYWHGERPYWSRAFAEGGGGVFIGRQTTDAGSGLDVMPIGVPVRRQGQVVGVLVATRMVGN